MDASSQAFMNPRSTSNAIGKQKVYRLLSYTLMFLMMACAVMTISVLIQSSLPGWHSGVIAGITLFIVIDRLYTYDQLKSLTPLSSEWAIAYGAQWIVIVLFIRFLLSYANGLDSFRTDLSLLARGSIVDLITAEFFMTLLLSVLAWVLTAQFLGLLDEIGLDMKWALSDEALIVQSGTIPAHQRLVNLIFSIGIGLVILTALSRIDLRATFSNSVGLPNVQWNRFSGAEAGALFYFILGLALLSLSRLMALQTHWNRLRIPVSSDNLVRQWGIYSLVFLLILATIVSLLPAGDSLGFFPLVQTFFGFVISVLFFIIRFFILLIMLLISLPFRLFGYSPPLLMNSAPPPELILPQQPSSNTSSAVWALIRSIFLWGTLIAILVIAFLYFVSQHSSILAALRRSRITNWLILAWQWLYRNADRTRTSFSRAIITGWQSLVARLEGKQFLPRPDFISVRTLDPRRRIYFFYLAMVRRGGEQGVMRKPSQTPAEYAVQLEKALPTASEDIDSLTSAFVEARYSRQQVDSRKANLVKSTWDRIRRALQSKSRSG
jgi:uncharacterized protein DUF4129